MQYRRGRTGVRGEGPSLATEGPESPSADDAVVTSHGHDHGAHQQVGAGQRGQKDVGRDFERRMATHGHDDEGVGDQRERGHRDHVDQGQGRSQRTRGRTVEDVEFRGRRSASAFHNSVSSQY